MNLNTLNGMDSAICLSQSTLSPALLGFSLDWHSTVSKGNKTIQLQDTLNFTMIDNTSQSVTLECADRFVPFKVPFLLEYDPAKVSLTLRLHETLVTDDLEVPADYQSDPALWIEFLKRGIAQLKKKEFLLLDGHAEPGWRPEAPLLASARKIQLQTEPWFPAPSSSKHPQGNMAGIQLVNMSAGRPFPDNTHLPAPPLDPLTGRLIVSQSLIYRQILELILRDWNIRPWADRFTVSGEGDTRQYRFDQQYDISHIIITGQQQEGAKFVASCEQHAHGSRALVYPNPVDITFRWTATVEIQCIPSGLQLVLSVEDKRTEGDSEDHLHVWIGGPATMSFDLPWAKRFGLSNPRWAGDGTGNLVIDAQIV